MPILGLKIAAGVAGGLILALSGALWWTADRLGSVRDSRAQVRADLQSCISANESNQGTISALRAAQERNETQRQEAIRRQQAAVERANELQERLDNEPTVTEITEAASGSECASEPMPDGVRLRLTRDRDGH